MQTKCQQTLSGSPVLLLPCSPVLLFQCIQRVQRVRGGRQGYVVCRQNVNKLSLALLFSYSLAPLFSCSNVSNVSNVLEEVDTDMWYADKMSTNSLWLSCSPTPLLPCSPVPMYPTCPTC